MMRFGLVCFVFVSLSQIFAEEAFQVSLAGNDTWSGKLSSPNAEKSDGPFATLKRAQQAALDLKKNQPDRKQPIVIQIQNGTYFLDAPLVFTPEQSGSADSPIHFEAAKDGKPIVSGGVQLTGFKVGADGRWTLQIPEVAAGKWNFSQLFVNGGRRFRSKLPHDSYFLIGRELSPTKDSKGFDRFGFTPGDLKPDWKNLQDIEVLTFHHWFMSRLPIESIDDKKNVVKLGGATPNKEYWAGMHAGWRYIIENVYEALRPGEFYLETKTGTLTYVPLPNEDPEKTEVIAPRLEKLVVFSGDVKNKKWVEHIQFAGIEFQHTNWVRPPKGYAFNQAEAGLGAAIGGEGARNILLDHCAVRHTGTYAVEFGMGSKNNRVQFCTLTDLGAGGVKIGEMGKRDNDEEVASHNSVTDTLIAYGGRVHPAAIGVWIGQAHDNTIEHNEIYDFYYSGVSAGWTWGYSKSNAHHNSISYNHIHKIGQGVLTDMGAIYTLGISPGTVLRGNHIHDIVSHSYGGWGIYFDEGSTGVVAEDNLVYRTKSSGFHQHYGKENIVRNNIFAFGGEAQMMRTRAEPHLSFTFERNIVYWKDAPLLRSNWNGTTDNFKLDNNLYWNGGAPFTFLKETLEQWQNRGQDVHSVIADPQFAPGFIKAISPNETGVVHTAEIFADAATAKKIDFKAFDITKSGIRGPFEISECRRAYPSPNGLPSSPPAQPINDDFEDTPVNEKPAGAVVSEENKTCTIRVSEEFAASGKRSLKFTDGPDQKAGFNPHMYFEPGFQDGTLESSFSVRMEPGANFSHEWRTKGQPYQTGPKIRIHADGKLEAGGRKLLEIPKSQWVKFQITCVLGKNANGIWKLNVYLPGETQPKTFDDLKCDAEFKSLGWFGFCADGNSGTFYVDDLLLKKQ